MRISQKVKEGREKGPGHQISRAKVRKYFL
jgi:hypothetical protein